MLLTQPSTRTVPPACGLLDDRSGELTEGVTLPSWGDSAYPGIEVTAEGDLLVVYYSCSQTIDANLLMGPGPLPGKYAPTSIYLAVWLWVEPMPIALRSQVS